MDASFNSDYIFTSGTPGSLIYFSPLHGYVWDLHSIEYYSQLLSLASQRGSVTDIRSSCGTSDPLSCGDFPGPGLALPHLVLVTSHSISLPVTWLQSPLVTVVRETQIGHSHA